jgi:hypothetical protein
MQGGIYQKLQTVPKTALDEGRNEKKCSMK